jgi:FKBP-type peptidyl-prolyl cis-trans isomerase FkpA
MSVTAVPLRPVAKGSVSRLWLALVLVVMAGLALAWFGSRQFGTTASGLRYQIIETGTGPRPTGDDFALVAYRGTLPDGTVFDENERAPMALDQMVPGFSEALTLMNKGSRMRAWIPAKLAYGDTPPPGAGIPAGSPLLFDIHLIDFKPRAEVLEAQRQMQMQQMMQQQMQQQGVPSAPSLQP